MTPAAAADAVLALSVSDDWTYRLGVEDKSAAEKTIKFAVDFPRACLWCAADIRWSIQPIL